MDGESALWFCQHCGKEIPEQSAYCRYCGGEQNIVGATMPRKNQATSRHISLSIGKTCPYCQLTVKPGVETLSCPTCGIVHHSDCWQENGGKCTTYGCTGVIGRESIKIRNEQVAAIRTRYNSVRVEPDNSSMNHVQYGSGNEEKSNSSRNALIAMFIVGLFGCLLLMAEKLK